MRVMKDIVQQKTAFSVEKILFFLSIENIIIFDYRDKKRQNVYVKGFKI